MNFGARLAEERKRLGLKQAEFARQVGTDAPNQSLYENGNRELRADYLARVAEAGVDVGYVLTGRRSEGGWLDDPASLLLSAYLTLPPAMNEAMVDLARTMREQFDRHSGPTLHGRPLDYRPGEPV